MKISRLITTVVAASLLTLPAMASVALGAVIVGTNGDDDLYTTSGNDEVYAKSGNDNVYAYLNPGGADEIYGGPDSDYIQGGGLAQIEGGKGSDSVCCGHHTTHGNAGADYIVGGFWVYGDNAGDTLVGDTMHQEFRGNDGDDEIFAFENNSWDDVQGNSGANDVCWVDGWDTVSGCETVHLIDYSEATAPGGGPSVDEARAALSKALERAALTGTGRSLSEGERQERIRDLFSAADVEYLLPSKE